jgi:hypothetical protein
MILHYMFHKSISLTSRLFLPGLLIGVLCLTACQTEVQETVVSFSEEGIPEQIDFNFHVKPILSDRCFKCHGPDPQTREGGLALHTEELAFAALGKEKDHYALVAGDTEASTLVQRIYSADPQEVMPPPESNLTLTEREKSILKAWVAQGAEWKKHWAFLPPDLPEVPTVENIAFVKNEIDHFILAELEQRNWQPSPRAEKEKLLRRLSFDLRGLPPSIEELDAFIADESPDAYEKWVDRFLDSDAYAERMALIWMDVARYADTHGYQDDFERTMWPWRDWVIHAFRQNMPYDQFITWQIAGDLLPNPSLEQKIATGFNRNHKITAEGGVIDEEYRVEYVADRVQTLGIGLLGLTMECARCHDHKYDPISQQDFYSTFALFNNIPEKGFVAEVNQNQAYAPRPMIKLTQQEMEEVVSFINNRDSVPELELMVMEEMETPRPTYILNRGQYDQYGASVLPTPPQAILPMQPDVNNDRLDLANWLFAQEHPLTARVAVNRLWQQLFGKGIVATPFDFGNQGALPTHPELLDFLAIKFQNEGWDMKAMLKYMVQSATYQQTANTSDQLLEADPENQYLARASRLRLSAEMIRDQALVVSGLLHDEVGGPSVKPYQPEGLWEETTGGGGGSTARYVMSTGQDQYRKSLYTFWKRTVPPPNMLNFDAPSRDLCTVERQETNTPLQALQLLNDPQIIEASQALAVRCWTMKSTREERLVRMFQLITSVKPDDATLQRLGDYFQTELERFEQDESAAKAYLAIGNYQISEDLPLADIAAYALIANTIINLDEAITRG